MKKISAILLSMVLAASMSVSAFAVDGGVSTPDSLQTTTTPSFTKTYTGNASSVYPAETLSFTVTGDSNNPTTEMITVGTGNQYVVQGLTGQRIAINTPTYTKVGVYTYTVAENAGNTQGVTYSNNTISVSVLVSYSGENGAIAVEKVGVTKVNGAKNDTITNSYNVGSLTVTKAVTGNMASRSQKFSIDVTFNVPTDKTVKSDITYTGSATNDTTITAAELEDGSETVTVELANGESANFTNIPVGVTYTVAEQSKHAAADANGSNPATGYTVSYDDNQEGTISVDGSTTTVTNEKGKTVDTGITTDNMPYILTLAVALIGAAVLFTRKRLTSR